MNLPTPTAPPVVKAALGAIGNEWGKFTQGYQNAGRSLEAAGARVRANVAQGQSDLNSGKSPTYGAINPLQGVFKKKL